MKDENYINIQGWMVNHLKLKPLHLILFAIIYGFSQDEESEFKGSLRYMEKAINVSRPTLVKALNFLLEKNLIEKRIEIVNSVAFSRYRISLWVVKKLYQGGKETLPGGGKETLPGGGKETLPFNNNIDNNKLNNNIINNKKEFFLDEEKMEKQFQLSGVFEKKKFFEKLSEQKENGVDVNYYYHAVDDWSQGLPLKDKRKYKTDRGWIAEARKFMRNDKDKNKLKMVGESENLTREMIAYLARK